MVPTAEEQAWLDATPFGERRSVTKNGTEFSVDRRSHWATPQAAPAAPYYPQPYEIGTPAPWTVPHVRIVPEWCGQPPGTIVCTAATSPMSGSETVTKVTFTEHT